MKRKNILNLYGKPLIAYTIEAARRAKTVSNVIVSTEDEEIAEISKTFGAKVPFLRPSKLAQDNSSLNEVIQFTLDRLAEKENHPDIFLVLFPTHPFRGRGLIDFMVNKLHNGCSSTHTVRKISHKDQSYMFKDRQGHLKRIPSVAHQQAPQPKNFFRQYGLVHGFNLCSNRKKTYIHVVKDPIGLIDIDTSQDFQMAEHVLKNELFDFGCSE